MDKAIWHSKLRKIFHEANTKWCPIEDIRLDIIIERHFVDRLHERFTYEQMADLLVELRRYLNSNYCIILFEANLNPLEAIKKRITLNAGTVCIIIFDKRITLRTCYTGMEDAA